MYVCTYVCMYVYVIWRNDSDKRKGYSDCFVSLTLCILCVWVCGHTYVRDVTCLVCVCVRVDIYMYSAWLTNRTTLSDTCVCVCHVYTYIWTCIHAGYCMYFRRISCLYVCKFVCIRHWDRPYRVCRIDSPHVWILHIWYASSCMSARIVLYICFFFNQKMKNTHETTHTGRLVCVNLTNCDSCLMKHLVHTVCPLFKSPLFYEKKDFRLKLNKSPPRVDTHRIMRFECGFLYHLLWQHQENSFRVPRTL